ncbi:POT family proton-dependent oligopeptide transporter [Sphingomonas kyeonggiensis]|uniref:POT family proton-dependent oligopeptide transporter n=1 Tax=Sphingomonas kyeonggiensis TaxID=1268553 RepID=A0A7W7K145_9SPHN|nr:MFS transporter [Sphingomonas kyeonggiensis]MBB4838731.1 POT family proton-dependent oligopeptide transporter [Sphingomonas kyeonggiensis]
MESGAATDKLLSPRFLVLAAMEFWERFAMSGMKSLLVLILVDHVLAGDLSRILGAAAVRDASTALFGPVSTTGLASQLYGYANALIYLSIPLGGLVGDLVGGRRRMVASGGALMLLGLMLMLSNQSFLIGLVPFAIGTGLLKGNLSAQVGLLFEDEAQRRRGYALYLGFLNAGIICGPLVCGTLAALAGPAYAIGAAALALLVGLVFYARNGTEPARSKAHAATSANTSPLAATALLIVALAAIYLCYSAYEQLSNIFLVWSRAHLDLRLGNWAMPVAWFLSLDGAFTLVLIAVSQLAMRALERRGITISAATQILIGCLFCAAGYLVLALGTTLTSGALPLAWALAYLLLIDMAIVLIWPSGLSLIAGIAPGRLVGLWMGLFYLHGFFASLWVGFSGVFYERMPAGQFWLLHAGVAAAGALLMLAAGLPLLRAVRARQAITTSACAKALA